MSFQEYNFNKIARSLHQLGELVFELQGGKAMLSLPSKKKKKCHSSCNFWLAAHWAYKPVFNNVILSHALEKAMAPHSSTLAWKIPWMEEPGRLQSMGSLGVAHD